MKKNINLFFLFFAIATTLQASLPLLECKNIYSGKNPKEELNSEINKYVVEINKELAHINANNQEILSIYQNITQVYKNIAQEFNNTNTIDNNINEHLAKYNQELQIKTNLIYSTSHFKLTPLKKNAVDKLNPSPLNSLGLQDDFTKEANDEIIKELKKTNYSKEYRLIAKPQIKYLSFKDNTGETTLDKDEVLSTSFKQVKKKINKLLDDYSAKNKKGMLKDTFIDEFAKEKIVIYEKAIFDYFLKPYMQQEAKKYVDLVTNKYDEYSQESKEKADELKEKINTYYEKIEFGDNIKDVFSNVGEYADKIGAKIGEYSKVTTKYISSLGDKLSSKLPNVSIPDSLTKSLGQYSDTLKNIQDITKVLGGVSEGWVLCASAYNQTVEVLIKDIKKIINDTKDTYKKNYSYNLQFVEYSKKYNETLELYISELIKVDDFFTNLHKDYRALQGIKYLQIKKPTMNAWYDTFVGGLELVGCNYIIPAQLNTVPKYFATKAFLKRDIKGATTYIDKILEMEKESKTNINSINYQISFTNQLLQKIIALKSNINSNINEVNTIALGMNLLILKRQRLDTICVTLDSNIERLSITDLLKDLNSKIEKRLNSIKVVSEKINFSFQLSNKSFELSANIDQAVQELLMLSQKNNQLRKLLKK